MLGLIARYNSKDEPSGASGWVEVSTVNIFSGRLNNTDLIVRPLSFLSCFAEAGADPC